jgi:hypothetical protein
MRHAAAKRRSIPPVASEQNLLDRGFGILVRCKVRLGSAGTISAHLPIEAVPKITHPVGAPDNTNVYPLQLKTLPGDPRVG